MLPNLEFEPKSSVDFVAIRGALAQMDKNFVVKTFQEAQHTCQMHMNKTKHRL